MQALLRYAPGRAVLCDQSINPARFIPERMMLTAGIWAGWGQGRAAEATAYH